MLRQTNYPTSAFLAVTLLCNSRCVMCDIWKHKDIDFLPLDVYRKLPASLKMIDVTGGEPFLRPDLPDLVKVLRETCPHARILITTNGLLNGKIQKELPKIIAYDPKIAIRISLDGIGKTHDLSRQIPQAYEKVIQTIFFAKKCNVRDLGIIYTLMKSNQSQFKEVYQFSKKNNLQFSLNIVHDSAVYFGKEKISLRPNPRELECDFTYLFKEQINSINPKDWAKAWFNRKSYEYLQTQHRPLPCGAGENFFYMDPSANIYMCHLRNLPIGNLLQSSFKDIWMSNAKIQLLNKTRHCHNCWMMCTTKDNIRKHPLQILLETMQMSLLTK